MLGANTAIEWCDATFNPWIGCTKVSPACDNCYAEELADRRFKMVKWGASELRERTIAANWREPLKWNERAQKEGRRVRVFCASLADVFDNEVPSSWRADLFDLIDQTPCLDWLLLTKRIGNAHRMINDACSYTMRSWSEPWPHVWIGATICNQEEADRDIPKLLSTPAAKRFLSIEPMLGSIDLTALSGQFGRWAHTFDSLRARHIHHDDDDQWEQWWERGIDWVIVGGESGANARPMHPDWALSLRDQCVDTGVPFFFKQWGEWHTNAVSLTTKEPVFRQFSTFDQWVAKPQWIKGGICLDTQGRILNIGKDFKTAKTEEKFPVTIMHRVGKNPQAACWMVVSGTKFRNELTI